MKKVKVHKQDEKKYMKLSKREKELMNKGKKDMGV
jgi:hypothetical protein